jgi:hypothetical protein
MSWDGAHRFDTRAGTTTSVTGLHSLLLTTNELITSRI